MLESKEYKKIYVKVSNKLLNELDMLSDKYGVSRSYLVAYYIGQGLEKERILKDSFMALSNKKFG